MDFLFIEASLDPNAVAFSRASLGAPMGKLLDELKTKVDPDTSLAFRRMAHDAGTDTAGALRDYVYKVVHGKTFTDMQIEEAKAKRDRLFCTGSNEGLIGTRDFAEAMGSPK